MRRLPVPALAVLLCAVFASNCAGPQGAGGASTAGPWQNPAGPAAPGGPSGAAPAGFAPGLVPGTAGFRIEPPPAFEAEGVRIAAFNAEFLFDGEAPEGQADFPWKGDPEASRAHRADVARVVRMLDADIVVLPETENLRTLEMLIEEGLADLGYTPYLVPGTDTFTRQNVGILSRVPFETTGRTDERAPVAGTTDTYGVSKNVFARFSLNGQPVTLVGVHFLARPDDRARKPQREAQAEVVARLVARERAENREVIVAGDFNDFDERILDRNGSVPITDVLARIKAAGADRGGPLVNVMGDVPQARRFTALWDRNRNEAIDQNELSAIDHILLSPGLHRRVREVHYVHSHDPRRVSDHFPIVVTIAP